MALTMMKPFHLDPHAKFVPSRASSSTPSPALPALVNKSLTLDEDYFERRTLRLLCTQVIPWADCDFPPQASLVVPGLYISDMYTATSPVALSRLGITHVVSVVRDPHYRYPAGVRNLVIPVDDTSTADLARYLDGAVAWIKRALQPPAGKTASGEAKEGRVLVHCMWGMSRSASIVLAYLMQETAMTLEDAMAFLKARRAVVCPNRGFLMQLSRFEARINQGKKRHLR
ncbi:hypothetical protein PLICRDRAFT_27366 [Plicaturopsis crispa FD-325 SS-3]|nr:hypothetical protein PLICRDRAFT_27366 [Plicaturopsis crispa FD-325 SS-3]